MQIVDREKLLTGAKEPTPANLLEPQVSRIDTPLVHGRPYRAAGAGRGGGEPR